MDLLSYRRIISAAIQNEIEAFLFYKEAAEKVKDAYLKEMFLQFSIEEKKHREILEGFRDDESAAISFKRVTDFHVAETIEERPLSVDMRPADAIALAMKKEDAAMRHYSKLAEVCQDAGQQKVFLELAAMESGHKAKMEAAFVDIGYPEVW
jgi:rubrerythrin